MTDWMMTSGVQTAVAVTALTLLVLASRKAVSSRFGARWAYALWALPVFRLFMPSLAIPAAWVAPFMPASAPTPILTTPFPEPIFIPEVMLAEPAPTGIDWISILPIILLLIWGLGVAIGAVILVARQLHHQRQIQKTTQAVSPQLQRLTQTIAERIKLSRPTSVRVATHNDAEGPMVMGLARPVIILPASFERELTVEQQRLALLHEMMHVKRGDLWAAAVMMGFRLLNWPNPLIHWAWPRFRADQEAACDASVLRLTGETARADYAETLLTAARVFAAPSTHTGRASPISGIGLSLSLHHPIKERLMILGSKTDQHSFASRWTLATLLMAGAALCAPISLAGDPGDKVEVKEKSVIRVVTSDSDETDSKSFEVRKEDGVTTYLRYKQDGTTEEITAEEMEAEFGVNIMELQKGGKSIQLFPRKSAEGITAFLAGEPGLSALLGENEGETSIRTMIMKSADGSDYDVDFEDGKIRVFKTDENGEQVEVETQSFTATGDGKVPSFTTGNGQIHLFSNENRVVEWLSKDGDEKSFRFEMTGPGQFGSTDARLRSAQSMLEATERMLGDLKEDAGSDAQKDLRDAERRLEQALKSLKKAQEAVEKSDTP